MATIYIGSSVLERLAKAQADVEWHVVNCQLCHVYGRCTAREAADDLFNRYRTLPRRRPGATRLKG